MSRGQEFAEHPTTYRIAVTMQDDVALNMQDSGSWVLYSMQAVQRGPTGWLLLGSF